MCSDLGEPAGGVRDGMMEGGMERERQRRRERGRVFFSPYKSHLALFYHFASFFLQLTV